MPMFRSKPEIRNMPTLKDLLYTELRAAHDAYNAALDSKDVERIRLTDAHRSQCENRHDAYQRFKRGELVLGDAKHLLTKGDHKHLAECSAWQGD